jgi:hypothetical protein
MWLIIASPSTASFLRGREQDLNRISSDSIRAVTPSS